MIEESKPMSRLMMDLIDSVSRLMRQELELARIEGSEKSMRQSSGSSAS